MKYRDKHAETLHKTAKDLLDVGLIDAATMRRFDESCLTPRGEFGPDEIRQLRKRLNVSQAVLASYLRVTVGTVIRWESGERKPDGPASKLLDLARAKGLSHIE